MAEPVPRIRAVGTIEEHRVSFDSSTGEICPNCNVFKHDIDSLEADLKLKNRKIASLEEDRERKAQRSEFWDVAMQLFFHYQAVCHKRKSPWSEKRFWEIEPHLRQAKFGPRVCQRAIDGAAYESWVSQRRNGTLKWHVDWVKIFESPSNVEDRANRAPKGWSLAYSLEMASWPPQHPGPEDVQSFWGIRPPKGWTPPATQTVTGQGTLLGVVADN